MSGGSGGRKNSVESAGYEDLLHCMICFDNYRTPKMLKCGHSFCAECLEGYLVTYRQQKKAHTGKLPCPTCRELTTMPVGGISALRNDFRIQKIEDMFKTVNLRGGKPGGQNCESCKSQKKLTKSRYFCTHCSISYCDSCIKKHNKNSLFKSHQIIDKSEKSSDIMCCLHKGEIVKFFCETCVAAACTLCIMHSHERHDVKNLSESVQNCRQDINNLISQLDSKIAELRSRESEMSNLRKTCLTGLEQAEMLIKERTRDMIEEIRAQERSLLKELQDRRDASLTRLSKESDHVSYQLAKAVSVKDFAYNTVQRKIDNSTNIKLMAVHGELVQRMRTVSDFNLGRDADIRKVTSFLPGRQDFRVGRLEDVAGTTAELQQRSEELLSASLSSIPDVMDTARREERERDMVRETPKLLLNINKMGNGRNEIRDPVGVACLPNGNIVVAEWGNKRLHIFDTAGSSVCVIAAGQIEPQGVAVTQMGNIMVADESHKRIEVFSEKGKSLAKWGLGHLFCPCGIAMSPTGCCVITDIAEHSVSIFEGENNCVKRFGGRGKGNEHFHNPLYVAVGQNGDIFISDSDNHCIKVFNSSGRFQYKIGSQGSGDGYFKYPRGICVHPDGNIIVADRNNNRISMFSPSGRFIRHLLTRDNGIKDPYAVVVSPAKNLVVTESAKGRASIKLFQMH